MTRFGPSMCLTASAMAVLAILGFAIPPAAADVGWPMNHEQMARLRERGWALLAPFVNRKEGLPSPDEWPASGKVGSLVPSGEPSRAFAPLRRALEQEAVRRGEQPLYEMTFFNRTAQNFIQDEHLDEFERTDELAHELVREIQFPRGSVAVKTFWFLLEPGEVIDVRKWDWDAIDGRHKLPRDLLPTRCVAQEPRPGCLTATESFYTMRVEDPADFMCEMDCPPLETGDLLILVALHIASKEMPDWLWATYWWRDADSPSGNFWTCGDAQREKVLGPVGLPWSNYSMDVAASFLMAKPRPADDADAACGFPGEIGDGEQLLAAYNPFVEALFENGLKSSCIDCHSRASTDGQVDIRVVPKVGEPPGPPVAAFEGHIRLDYLWSLRRGLKGTEFPLFEWPGGDQ